ncbi:hypothetical protein N9026_00160 [bacterium]|nr:hypothetical protein [bacterium]
MNLTPAVESILQTYDSEELSHIAEGKFEVTENVEFFDKHEADIYDYLRAAIGDDFLFKLVAECADMNAMKNKLVWTYTELIAKDYFAQMSDEEVEEDEEDEEESESYFHVYWENGYLLNTIGRFDTKEEAMKYFLSEAEEFKANPGKYTGDNPEDWDEDENAQPHIGFDYVDDDDSDNDYEINSYSLDDGLEKEVQS